VYTEPRLIIRAPHLPPATQVWFHRRACVSALAELGHPADFDGELEFVSRVLSEDAKNYHAWGHRQWFMKKFSMWEGELDYLDTLLTEDLRNNSAWNQR
jgi:protein farnesyltransferase/geranylgeranyltransferase type-1 subunit alpha